MQQKFVDGLRQTYTKGLLHPGKKPYARVDTHTQARMVLKTGTPSGSLTSYPFLRQQFGQKWHPSNIPKLGNCTRNLLKMIPFHIPTVLGDPLIY